MTVKAENERIYVLKAICAYLIILLHCKFPGYIGSIFEVLSRIAVTCFFMISGYFAFPYNSDKIKQKINNNMKSIFYV